MQESTLTFAMFRRSEPQLVGIRQLNSDVPETLQLFNPPSEKELASNRQTNDESKRVSAQLLREKLQSNSERSVTVPPKPEIPRPRSHRKEQEYGPTVVKPSVPPPPPPPPPLASTTPKEEKVTMESRFLDSPLSQKPINEKQQLATSLHKTKGHAKDRNSGHADKSERMQGMEYPLGPEPTALKDFGNTLSKEFLRKMRGLDEQALGPQPVAVDDLGGNTLPKHAKTFDKKGGMGLPPRAA